MYSLETDQNGLTWGGRLSIDRSFLNYCRPSSDHHRDAAVGGFFCLLNVGSATLPRVFLVFFLAVKSC